MRFSTSLVAFVYLSFAAAVAIPPPPTVPLPPSKVPKIAPNVPAGVTARQLPNVGNPPVVGGAAGMLPNAGAVPGTVPGKLPRDNAVKVGAELGAATKGENGEGGKDRRQNPAGVPLASSASLPVNDPARPPIGL